MAEGFDPGEAPTRRGRKDPELQRALLVPDPLEDSGEDHDESGAVVYEGLSQGAMIISKLTQEFVVGTEGDRAWSTYGAVDHILPGEDTQGAFERLVGHTVDGLYTQTETLREAIAQQQEARRTERRTRRIVPAGGQD